MKPRRSSETCASGLEGAKVYRRMGERCSPQCILERDSYRVGSVHVWGGMARFLHYGGQSDRSAICGRDEIGYTFQQDNARPYTSRVAKDYLQNEGIDTFKMKLLMQCLDPQNPLI